MTIATIRIGESIAVGYGRASVLHAIGDDGDVQLAIEDEHGRREFHAQSGQPFVCAGRVVLFIRGARRGKVLLGVGRRDEKIPDMVRAARASKATQVWDASKRLARVFMPSKQIVAALAILFCDWAYCQDAFTSRDVIQVREPTTNCPEAVNHEVRNHVVQVHVHGGLGSGIYLGDRLVLTAAHVVDRHRRARVNFPNPNNPKGPFHESVVGSVVATDRTWDQAVIELDLFPKHNPPGSPLANDNPKAGDKVTFAGYPGGRSLKMMRGQFERYSMASGQRTADWFDADAGVISGYSGGAAYSDDGTLFGNLWGSTGQSTVAVCLGRTKRFLLPWNARLEAWRLAIKSGNAGTMQWGSCPPGGNCPPGYGGGGPRYIEPGDGDDAPSAPPGSGGGGSLTPVPPPVSPPIVVPDASDIENQLDAIVGRIDKIVGKIDKIKGCECDPGDSCQCEDKPEPPPTVASKVFVVTGEPKAEYFGRLKTDVEKTATYFDAVTLRPPPPGLNVGTLPAISYFVDGVHVITHRGVIPVQSQLYKIRNGEFQ